MLKLNTQDLKQIEKLKKKVHKQYPGAYLAEVGAGYYTILQEQDDLLPKDILMEWCVPPVNNPIKAWEAALTGAKATFSRNCLISSMPRLEAASISKISIELPSVALKQFSH